MLQVEERLQTRLLMQTIYISYCCALCVGGSPGSNGIVAAVAFRLWCTLNLALKPISSQNLAAPTSFANILHCNEPELSTPLPLKKPQHFHEFSFLLFLFRFWLPGHTVYLGFVYPAPWSEKNQKREGAPDKLCATWLRAQLSQESTPRPHGGSRMLLPT